MRCEVTFLRYDDSWFTCSLKWAVKKNLVTLNNYSTGCSTGMLIDCNGLQIFMKIILDISLPSYAILTYLNCWIYVTVIWSPNINHLFCSMLKLPLRQNSPLSSLATTTTGPATYNDFTSLSIILKLQRCKSTTKQPYCLKLQQKTTSPPSDQPTKIYDQPTKIYDQPLKVYNQPTKIYNQPTKIYDQPIKIYNQPTNQHPTRPRPPPNSSQSAWTRQWHPCFITAVKLPGSIPNLRLRSFVWWVVPSWFKFGGFLKWWYPTTIVFPTKNDHFGGALFCLMSVQSWFKFTTPRKTLGFFDIMWSVFLDFLSRIFWSSEFLEFQKTTSSLFHF